MGILNLKRKVKYSWSTKLLLPAGTWFCVVLFLILQSSLVTASVSDTAVEKAIDYFAVNQNSDGSWSSGDKELVDTVEVIKAILPHISSDEDANTAAQASLEYIEDINEIANTDFTARKLYILANSTADISSIISALIAYQNSDGGWGLGDKKQSDALDTILVAEALLQDGDSNNTGALRNARDYIIEKQKESGDGSWILANEANMPSDIARTAMGLITLMNMKHSGMGLESSSLRGAVEDAQDFLEGKGDPNNSNIWSTADVALAYKALLYVKQPQDVNNFMSVIMKRQSSNGSWGDDIFTTALALQAINGALPPSLGDMADLAVSNNYITFTPSDVNVGDKVDIKAMIMNYGTASAGSFWVDFYNGDPNDGGELIGNDSISGIAAGSSADANVVTTDTNDWFDDQYIIVIADPNYDVIESDYSNNFGWKILNFGGGVPDINIAASDIHFYDIDGNDLSDDPNAYEPIAIVAEVINLGAGFPNSFDVNFVDLGDANFTGEITFENGLAHGQKAIATFITGLPEGSPRTIRITADPNGAIDESDESNNSAVKDVNVLAGSAPPNSIDLKITTSDITLSDPNAEPGETITITFTIHNDGNVASGDFYVMVTDGSPYPYVDGYYLIQDNILVESIPAGANTTSEPISYKIQYREGGNEIFVLADRNWGVTEYNKSNNIASRKMQVADVPDLTSSPGLIRVSHTNLVESRNVQVLATIRNIGGAEAENVNVKFATKDANTYYVFGEDNIDSISAYGTSEVSTVFHPVAPDYNLWVLIDYEDQITETDENNNEIEKSNVSFDYEANEPNVTMYLGDSNTPQYEFGAYDTVRIDVNLDSSYEDANYFGVMVWIETPDGNYVWPSSGSSGYGGEGGGSETNTWSFNTRSMTPSANYSVNVDVYDLYTWNPVQQTIKPFEITAEKTISTPVIYTEDRYLQLGSSDISLTATVTMYSWSNQNITDANIVVTVYDPNDPNSILDTWSEGIYSLAPGQSFALPLTTYYGITQPGDCNYVVEAYYDHNGVDYEKIAKNYKIIHVIPGIGLSAFKSLSPELLDPADQAKVDVRIDLISSGMLPESRSLDVVLVIDNSKSMTGDDEDKLTPAKNAAKTFAEKLLTGTHRAAVVEFNTNATLVGLGFSLDPCEVVTNIDNISQSNGSTATGDAIEVATKLFLDDSPPDRKRVILLLTDGWPVPDSEYGRAKTAAQNADTHEITIVMIGLELETTDEDYLILCNDCKWWLSEFDFDDFLEWCPECEDDIFYDSWPVLSDTSLFLCSGLEIIEIIASQTTGGLSYYSPTTLELDEIYKEIHEEITTTGIENIHVVDYVNYDANMIELDIGSIDPMPTYILEPEVNDSNYTIVWHLPSMDVDEAASFGYTVDLYDLIAGQTRVVNSHLLVTSYNAQSEEQMTLEKGPQIITVNEVATLRIETDESNYSVGDTANLTITFAAPDGISHRLITTQDDFTVGESGRLYVTNPNNVDANTSPGNLLLAKKGDGTYENEGTINFIVDAGSGAYWGDITFTDEYSADSILYERTNNYLRSNLVKDVYYYDRTSESGNWWEDSSKSWHQEVNDTIVHHALTTEDGWIVEVPSTAMLDAAIDGNDFSIEGWISSSEMDVNTVLFYRGDSDANYLSIYKRNDAVYVEYENSGVDSNSRNVTLESADGWHYIALTVSNSSAKLYVDGNDVNDSWDYQTGDVFGALTGTPILIGGEPNSADPNYYLTQTCRIDELSIYNKQLDANDIGAHRDSHLLHEDPNDQSGLVAWWNFDPSPQDQSGLDVGGRFIQTDSTSDALRRITGRSSDPNFPEKSYIIATHSSIEIVDSQTDSLWMRFLMDRDFLWDSANLAPSSVFAVDGKIYVGQQTSLAGLSIIDFVTDEVRKIDGSGLSTITDANIADRFTINSVFGDPDSSIDLRNGYVLDIMAINISDVNYIAVGTRGGLTLIEGESTPYDSNCSDWVTNVFLTDSNDMYFSTTTNSNGDSLYAFYDIQSKVDDFEPNAVYGAEDTNDPNFLENVINDIYAVAGDVNNTVYVATTEGLVRIEENQAVRNSGTKTVYLSEESTDGNYVNILDGSSNIVTAVWADVNEIWVGTSAGKIGTITGLKGVGNLTIIDANDDSVKDTLDINSTPSVPRGTINALGYGVIGTSSGIQVFEPSSISGNPVEIKARCIYTDDIYDPNEAVSDWTDWITVSGTSLFDPDIIDANSTNKLGQSRYLELLVKLNKGADDSTPVLEGISVRYTPENLIIRVTVEDADGSEVSTDIPLIEVRGEDLGTTNTENREYTANISPADYYAVATLIDTRTGVSLLRATDGFVVLGESTSDVELLDCDVTTDRVYYYPQEIMAITSVVRNDSNATPIDKLDVYISIHSENGTNLDIPDTTDDVLSYSIYSLQPGDVDVRPIPFAITNELDPATGYYIYQEVVKPGYGDINDTAEFEIRWPGEIDKAIGGSLSVDPTLIKSTTTNIIEITFDAENTGNDKLDDVVLYADVHDISGGGDPCVIKSFEYSIGDMVEGESVGPFTEYYIPANLDSNSYPVRLWASYKYSDVNYTSTLDIKGFDVVDEVTSTVGKYIVIDLGSINDSNSFAYALNDYGNVTGYANVDGNSHAFLWRCGTMEDLDPCSLYGHSIGWGINNSLQIAGGFHATSFGGDANAFIWENDDFNDIGTGPDGNYPVAARAISTSGQIVGQYTLNDGSKKAFLWYEPNGANAIWDNLTNWNMFDGNSITMAINNKGQIAGWWGDEGDVNGFVSTNGVIEDAGRHDFNDTYLLAIELNGRAVGYTDATDINIPVLYANGIFRAIDPNDAIAYGINSAGEIVGSYITGSEPNAFIWRGGILHNLNLNEHLALVDTSWNFKEARAINDDGQIVGFGTKNGKTRAFRLDPVPFEVEDPNLVLWLRADTGVVKDSNDSVTKWIDQSFNGNDVNSPDAGSQPTWMMSTSCCDPVVSFDGVNDVLQTTLDTTYDGNSTIFMVVHTTSDPNGALFASDAATEPNAFEIKVNSNDANLILSSVDDYVLDRSAAEKVMLEFVIDDVNVSFYKNGIRITTETIGSDDAKRYTHYILGKDRAGNYLEYKVAEVLVFEGALSDTRREDVEDYLLEKHEIDGPNDIGQPFLWLSVDMGVTVDTNDADSNDHVSFWADQSGNNHHASQNEPNNQPILEESGVFDCQPGILFSGSYMDPNTSDPEYYGIAGIICLDRSESMNTLSVSDSNSTRFEKAQEASVKILEGIRDDAFGSDYAALIEFVGDAKVEKDITQEINDVITAVDGLDPPQGVGTNFKSPLDVARQEFETLGSIIQTKRVILVTDGQGNKNFTAVRNAADNCRDDGIIIHTVFIPLDPTEEIEDSRELLQYISDTTGGTYHEVYDENQLLGVFLEILADMQKSSFGNTLYTVFKTGSDVSTRQVLFSEGDPNAGLNLYIDSNELYFSAWDLETETSSTTWGPSYVKTAIEANSIYSAMLTYNYNDTLTAYINGGAFDTATVSANDLPSHESSHSIGGNPNPTYFHDGNDPNSYYYVGHIAEMLYYDKALSTSERSSVDVYLSNKYGFEIRYNDPPVFGPNNPDTTTTETHHDGTAEVTLTVDVSDDANDLTYEWYEDGVLIATGPNPTVTLTVGTHQVELRVTDSDGETVTTTITVTVEAIEATLASSSLIGSWKFDGDANDSSGNEFDANLVSEDEPNCWTDDGMVDGAVSLDADSNEYVDLNPDGNTVDYLPGGSSARTIMCWFEAGDNNGPMLFDYGLVDPNGSGSRLGVTASEYRIAVTTGSHSHTVGVEFDTPLRGWHHITVVFPEGALRSDQFRIYLDGVRQNISTLDNSRDPIAVKTNTWDPNAYAYIGRDWEGNYFDGAIDDLRICSYALREDEMPVKSASQTSYHVVDLGPLEPNDSPQAGEGWAINNLGGIVGRTTIFLDPNTTYYWRIDEKNGCGTTEGDLWNFTTGTGAVEPSPSEFAKAPVPEPAEEETPTDDILEVNPMGQIAPNVLFNSTISPTYNKQVPTLQESSSYIAPSYKIDRSLKPDYIEELGTIIEASLNSEYLPPEPILIDTTLQVIPMEKIVPTIMFELNPVDTVNHNNQIPLVLANTNYLALDDSINYSQTPDYTGVTAYKVKKPLGHANSKNIILGHNINSSLKQGHIKQSALSIEIDTQKTNLKAESGQPSSPIGPQPAEESIVIEAMDAGQDAYCSSCANNENIPSEIWDMLQQVPLQQIMDEAVFGEDTSLVAQSGAPPAPDLNSPGNGATCQGPTSVSLQWYSSGADYYKVYYDTNSNPTTPGTTAGCCSKTISTQAGTTYYWRLKACNNPSGCDPGGCSSYSTEWSFTTKPAAPNVPTLNSPGDGATCQSVDGVTLIWTDVSGETSYRVYFDDVNSPVDYNTNPADSNSYSTGALEPNTTYYWKVRAYKDCDVYSESSVRSFSTEPGKATSPNPNHTGTGVALETDLSWTAGAGTKDVNGHHVYFGTDSPPTNIENGTVQSGTTYYPAESLDSNTTYYWRIDEEDDNGCIRTGDTWEFTTCTLPGKASNPDPNGTTGEPIDVVLTWTPGSLASSHDVYFGTDFNDVNDATTASAEYMGNVDVNYFDTRRIHAFTWTDSNMTTLTSLGQLASPDFNSWAEAFGLSESGNIVGVSYDANGNPHAVVWEPNSTSYDLLDLHSINDANDSVAYDISDSNWVVGRVDVNAFILKDPNDPNMIILPSVFSEVYQESVARAITEGRGDYNSVITGWSGGCPVIWDNLDANELNIHLLDSLAAYRAGKAYRINEYGQAVGYYWSKYSWMEDPNEHKAFIGNLENGLTCLGTLESGNISRAYGINNRSQIVGEATIDSNDATLNAFIYDGDQMYNLNNLVEKDPNDSNDILITTARSINDDGYIVGYGKVGDINDANNYDRALLLIPARPVAHWQFDETSGDVAIDVSVRGNHGQLGNGPVWTSGKIRGALQFDGINDYVTTTMNGFVSSSQPRSVSVWINWDGSSGYNVIYGYGNNAAGEMFGLFINSSGDLYFWDYGTNWDTTINITAGEWTHIVLTYDGTNLTAYKGGAFVNTTTKALDTVLNASMIGRNIFVSNHTFNGLIDDIRIYPYALNENEISEIYQEQN